MALIRQLEFSHGISLVQYSTVVNSAPLTSLRTG